MLFEPGSFRTDWAGRSAKRTQTAISAYKETVGKRIERFSGQEAGDPAKLAEAVITVTESENPPLRLLLGGCLRTSYSKLTNLLNEIEAWKETTINTDYDRI